MIHIKLVNKTDIAQHLIETHEYYDIMIHDVKIGELIHRLSKNTYNVNFLDKYKMLDAEYFRQLVYLFDKETVEEKFSKAINILFKTCINSETIQPGDNVKYCFSSNEIRKVIKVEWIDDKIFGRFQRLWFKNHLTPEDNDSGNYKLVK